MRKRFKTGLCFLLVFLFIGMFSACASGTEPKDNNSGSTTEAQSSADATTKAAEPVTLKMAICGNQDAMDSLKAVLDKHLDPALNTKVELTLMSGDVYWDKIATMFAGGTPPDLMQVSEPFQKYAKQGVLLALDDFISKSQTFNAADFYQPALKFYQYDGKQYGIPCDLNTWVVFYNEDLFAKAGEKTPWEYYKEGNWTWENYLALAKKLTIKDGDRYVQFGSTYPAIAGWWYSAWVFANGGKYLNEDKTECIVNDPRTIEAFKFTTELANLHKVAPSPVTGGSGDLTGMTFQTGKIAMQTEGSWWMGGYKDADFKWNIAPMPIGHSDVDPLTSYIHNSGYAITKANAHPEQSWGVLEAIANPDSYAMDAAKRGVIPPRPSVVADNNILKAPGLPSNAPIISDMLSKGVLFQFTPTYAEEGDVYYKNGEMILNKEITPEEGARKMIGEVNAILKK